MRWTITVRDCNIAHDAASELGIGRRELNALVPELQRLQVSAEESAEALQLLEAVKEVCGLSEQSVRLAALSADPEGQIYRELLAAARKHGAAR